MSRKLVIFTLVPLLANGAGLTCNDVKTKYQEAMCCGAPEKTVDGLDKPCPYDFSKPSCAEAGVQAPRDVSTGSVGTKPGSFAPMNEHQRQKLGQTNIHFHLGAEHKSGGEYDHTADGGHRRLAGNAADHDHPAPHTHPAGTGPHGHHDIAHVTPGWMCDAYPHSTEPYAFEYCKDVEVGKTYEIHYVYSSAGAVIEEDNDEPAYLTDGLGQAANGNGLLNPLVSVQAQVVFIVSGEDASVTADDMVHGWQTEWAKFDSVMYSGSTTGTGLTNDVCSPYAVSWHVDRKCHAVSAKSFDKMCKDMMDLYKMHADVWPHGSRTLVDSKYVVPWSEVETLTVS